MTSIIEIPFDSPAGRELRRLMIGDGGYCLRVAPDHGGPGTVALKLNEGMWSAPLSTVADGRKSACTHCDLPGCEGDWEDHPGGSLYKSV